MRVPQPQYKEFMKALETAIARIGDALPGQPGD